MSREFASWWLNVDGCGSRWMRLKTVTSQLRLQLHFLFSNNHLSRQPPPPRQPQPLLLHNTHSSLSFLCWIYVLQSKFCRFPSCRFSPSPPVSIRLLTDVCLQSVSPFAFFSLALLGGSLTSIGLHSGFAIDCLCRREVCARSYWTTKLVFSLPRFLTLFLLASRGGQEKQG